jgi:hypothetical protein
LKLDSERAIAKALGESTLADLPKEKFPDLVALLPEISEELRPKVFELVPGFLQYSMDAMNAVEETFKHTLSSNDRSQTELSQSFSELRAVLNGRLERDGLSEEHERFLIKNLVRLQTMQLDKDTENKRFLAEQASATRRAKVAQTALPILEAVISAGVRIMLTRSRL